MRWILGTFLGAALLTWAFPLPVTAQQETAIRGSLSNFDVHQGCFDEADNFELDILGDIDPDDFTGFFPGWGSPPRFDDIKIGGVDLGDGAGPLCATMRNCRRVRSADHV